MNPLVNECQVRMLVNRGDWRRLEQLAAAFNDPDLRQVAEQVRAQPNQQGRRAALAEQREFDKHRALMRGPATRRRRRRVWRSPWHANGRAQPKPGHHRNSPTSSGDRIP